jgi:hypothetical protein
MFCISHLAPKNEFFKTQQTFSEPLRKKCLPNWPLALNLPLILIVHFTDRFYLGSYKILRSNLRSHFKFGSEHFIFKTMFDFWTINIVDVKVKIPSHLFHNFALSCFGRKVSRHISILELWPKFHPVTIDKRLCNNYLQHY